MMLSYLSMDVHSHNVSSERKQTQSNKQQQSRKDVLRKKKVIFGLVGGVPIWFPSMGFRAKTAETWPVSSFYRELKHKAANDLSGDVRGFKFSHTSLVQVFAHFPGSNLSFTAESFSTKALQTIAFSPSQIPQWECDPTLAHNLVLWLCSFAWGNCGYWG